MPGRIAQQALTIAVMARSSMVRSAGEIAVVTSLAKFTTARMYCNPERAPFSGAPAASNVTKAILAKNIRTPATSHRPPAIGIVSN